jgi:hypothetical protein
MIVLLILQWLYVRAVYGIYSLLQWKGFIKTKRATKKVEVKKTVNHEEWLKGTYYNQGGAKKVAGKGKTGPKLEEASEEVKKAK